MSETNSATTQNVQPSVWRWAAIGCGSIAVSAITALVIVATVKSADTLSVVALALAVLAFIAQLLQAAGQTIAANQQYHQMSSINTRAQEALAEIRQSTGEALARRDQQFGQLLQTLVPSALAESLVSRPDITSSVDVDALGKQLVASALNQLAVQPTSVPSEERPPTTRDRIDRVLASRPEAARALRSLPASEQIRVWRALSGFDATELEKLTDTALRDLISRVE